MATAMRTPTNYFKCDEMEPGAELPMKEEAPGTPNRFWLI